MSNAPIIKKPLDAVEARARTLVAGFLGVPVVQHDGTGGNSLPDLRIEYPDGRRGLVEVVRDIEHDAPSGGAARAARNRVQQAQRLARAGDTLIVPGLTRNWMAELTVAAMDIRAIRNALPAILSDAERRNETYLQALPWSGFDPAAFRLYDLGVRYVQSLGMADADGCVSLIAPNSGTWAGGLDHLAAWCGAVLQREADVPAKLTGADCDERHAFLVATTQGDLAVYRSLWAQEHPGYPDQLPALPSTPPDLPPGVDRVWVLGLERVVAWSPETGWVDVYVASSTAANDADTSAA
jgi:hypothetical protein